MDGENIESDKINSAEEEINAVGESALYMNHGEKFKAVANKGKMKGNEFRFPSFYLVIDFVKRNLSLQM